MLYTPEKTQRYLPLLGVLLLIATSCSRPKKLAGHDKTDHYANVLDMKHSPKKEREKDFVAFFDMGAWHGFALAGDGKSANGFSGPFSSGKNNGTWLSDCAARLELLDPKTGESLGKPRDEKKIAFPGRLEQSYRVADFQVELTLYFVDGRSNLVNAKITNTSDKNIDFDLRWAGSALGPKALIDAKNGGAGIFYEGDAQRFDVFPSEYSEIDLSGQSYSIQESKTLSLKANASLNRQVLQCLTFDSAERGKVIANRAQTFANAEKLYKENRKRWEGYVTGVTQGNHDWANGPAYRRLAVKCLQTLVSNWRSPAGELKHSGLFPSYHYRGFNGFWAWDSWKHAVALAYFDGKLAQDQILAMFDYQNERGMIADCVFRDTSIENHNWRDTKPPLAGWAVAEVYARTGDKEFLKVMYPKLKRYHEWWTKDRDHDKNGLCEYGSTDGTRVAAAWESGMDNAVRFDSAKMLKNNSKAWSLDQESVDLNSFLFDEKNRLAEIAGILGEKGEEARYRKEAKEMAERVRKTMYDEEDGYYYDVRIPGQSKIKVQGPEGWSPLWAGLATAKQAEKVKSVMLDPAKFNGKLPFPTLSMARPELKPVKGYWRGPVWVDQVYFAVSGLRRYGFTEEANAQTRKFIETAEGLLGNAPVRENYNPKTAEGLNAKHFSWTAAHILMMLKKEKPDVKL
ncbi:MGH1-like glycoside hydrolase domain-containing protein [Fulvitalea axinellae]